MNVREINDLHDQAMNYADLALIARRNGDEEQFIRYSLEAYEAEADAARLVASSGVEPTRSVLHRSAATLALDCGRYREAEKLIAVALAGDPPDHIAEELRDLLEQVNFARHLDQRGIILNPGELQLSVAGSEIGYGIAPSQVVIERISNFETFLHRTVEHKRQRPYRKGGKPPQSITDAYTLYLSVRQGDGFSLTLRMGSQQMLPGFNDVDEVLDNVIEYLSLINDKEFIRLQHAVHNDAYYRMFITLARSIAPDGEKVSSITFRAMIRGEVQELRFDTRQDQIVLSIDDQSDDVDLDALTSIVQIGTLQYAQSGDGDDQIRILDRDGEVHRFVVSDGLDDIVRTLWGELVEVRALKGQRAVARVTDVRRAYTKPSLRTG